MADAKKNPMIAQAESADDILADLNSKIDALELGLHDYEARFTAWSERVLTKVGNRVECAEQGLDARERELSQRAAVLDRAAAEWNDREAEFAERQAACETRERELKEVGELVAQAQREAAAREQAANAGIEEREAQQREHEQAHAREIAESKELRTSIVRQSEELDRGRNELKAAIKQFEDECAARRAELDIVLSDAQKRGALVEQQAAELSAAKGEFRRTEDQFVQREDALRQRAAKCDDLLQTLEVERQRLETVRGQLAAKFHQLETRESEVAAREGDLTNREQAVTAAASVGSAREAEIESQVEILRRGHADLEGQRAELQARLIEHQTRCEAVAKREKEVEDHARGLAERTYELARREARVDDENRNAEALINDYRQREVALAAGITDLEGRAAALDGRENGLRAAEAALKIEGVELNAARESLEAETAARRMECERLDAEAAERRAALDRDRAAHEAEVQVLRRRNEELDRRAEVLSNRDGDLALQQTKLEAALDNIKNDRLAVQKARAVADEVAQSRADELGRVHSEADSLRSELATARDEVERLESELHTAREAAEREADSVRQAQSELRILAAKSASDRAAAIDSLEAQRARELGETRGAMKELGAELDRLRQEKQRIENDLLSALESRESAARSLEEAQAQVGRLAGTLEDERAHFSVRLGEIEKREQETLALIDEAERKRASACPAPDSPAQEVAALAREIENGRTGVAKFWTAFAARGASAGGIGGKVRAESDVADSPDAANNIAPPVDEPSPNASAGASAHDSTEGSDNNDDVVAAMKAALAAAEAEVEKCDYREASPSPPPAPRSRAAAKRGKASRNWAKPSEVAAPIPQAESVIEASKEEAAVPQSANVELDIETRGKLRTLKRLNPTKSEEELLAMIAAEAARPKADNSKRKRSWFSLR